MKWHGLVVAIYALFIFAGGMIGFMKAHSQISLIIGSTAAFALLISSAGIYYSQTWGFFTAFVLTTLLMFFFGYRFYLKPAFFPGGMMTLLSVATLLFLSYLPRK